MLCTVTNKKSKFKELLVLLYLNDANVPKMAFL